MPRLNEEPLGQKWLPDPDDPRPEMPYPLWAPNFLAVLRETGNFSFGSEAAGVDLTTVRRYRYGDVQSTRTISYRGNAIFCREINDALDHRTEALTFSAMKRAMKTSDRLAMFFLRAMQPELYNPPRIVEHTADQAMLARVDDMRARLLARLAPAELPAPSVSDVDGEFTEI